MTTTRTARRYRGHTVALISPLVIGQMVAWEARGPGYTTAGHGTYLGVRPADPANDDLDAVHVFADAVMGSHRTGTAAFPVSQVTEGHGGEHPVTVLHLAATAYTEGLFAGAYERAAQRLGRRPMCRITAGEIGRYVTVHTTDPEVVGTLIAEVCATDPRTGLPLISA